MKQRLPFWELTYGHWVYMYRTGIVVFIRDILGKLMDKHIQKFSSVGVQFQLRSEISDNVFSPSH